MSELSLNALFDAYFDCRHNKRNSLSQLEFEVDLEKNLMNLWRDLQDGSYKIGPSIAFVVTYPKVREVWAANFRDRIVHHLIYNSVKDRFYNRFIRDSYACIPQRGLHDGCQRITHFIRSITNNGRCNAFVLKADIANFFTSINLKTTISLTEKYVHEKWIRDLFQQIVFHDPRPTAIFQSSQSLFDKVPRHKSLLHAPAGFGLPIGNLTSQFLANVYLNELDQFVKKELKIKYYGRYMDDIFILGKDAKTLNDNYKEMDAFLLEHLGLRFHPNKKSLQPIHQGFSFTGFIFKPGRIYLRRSVIARGQDKIRKWKHKGKPFDEKTLTPLRDSLTSYLGMLRQVNGFRLRKKLCEQVVSLFIYPDTHFTKLVIPKNRHKTLS